MSNQKVLFLKPPMDGPGKNVVRDFLYGCWCNGRRIGGMQMPPLTELIAASHARQDGLNVVFIDAQIKPARYESIVRRVSSPSSGVCPFSLYNKG